MKSIEGFSPRAKQFRVLELLAILLIGIAAATAHAVDTQAPQEWENPRLTGLNNQPPHATMVICPDAATALKIRFAGNSERVKSSFYRSLNGSWKYHYSSNQLARVPDFWSTNFDDRAWGKIEVPSNVELSGHGIPIYVNYNFPWRRPWTPPFAPGDDPNNTVNAYRRAFEIPGEWSGRRVMLTFDGVNSFFDLWINGQKVGMGKDARTPVEFDLTKFVKPGTNVIAVENFRWCDGSYLEDQDFWRMSGIFRDVYLWSPPEVHIRDFEVKTDLDAEFHNAKLSVNVSVTNASAAEAAVKVEASLMDPSGKSVGVSTIELKSPARGEYQAAAFLAAHCRLVAENVKESKIKGAGHWLVQENTAQVQQDLLDFFMDK